MANKNFGLGKGLDALFIDNTSPTQGVVNLSVNEIESNKNQPRKFFDDESLAGLAESIQEHGVLQPVIVRALVDGSYQLIAGERRWRAAKSLGLTEIPAIVKELDDLQSAEIALVENLQREDLNPIEEAAGYKDLMSVFNLNQEEIAQKVGKSRSAVANALRLLNLPESIEGMVREEKLSAGHARALLGAKTEDMETLAELVASQGMSVRETERLVRRRISKKDSNSSAGDVSDKSQAHMGGDTFFVELEMALREETGRKVKVEHTGDGKGRISVEFFSKEDAADIAARLTNS